MIRFAGYAALFDRIDRGGDIIRRGAFDITLNSRCQWPLLFEHRARAPVGLVEHAKVDRRGLRVIGHLFDKKVEPQTDALASALLHQPSEVGLSFGYRVLDAHGHAPRHLTALDLIEISLVAMPMQPLARVHAVQNTSS